MSYTALKWLYWLLATVGVAGTIALLVFAPTALGIIWRALARVFTFILSYRLGCALIAAGFAFVAADYHRARIDEANWKQQIARFEEAQHQRDAEIDKAARESVRQEIDQEKQASADTDKQRTDFDVNLKPLAPTDTVCRVGDDAGKLRLIAGGIESKAHRRMPKIRWHRRAS